MKRLVCLGVALIICRWAAALAGTPTDGRAEELLVKLFPSASVEAVNSWFGKDEPTRIIYPVSLRGRQGLIRVSDARTQSLGRRYVAVAFEIFLATDRDVRQLVASRLSQNPSGALKLLQAVV